MKAACVLVVESLVAERGWQGEGEETTLAPAVGRSWR